MDLKRLAFSLLLGLALLLVIACIGYSFMALREFAWNFYLPLVALFVLAHWYIGGLHE